MSESSFPFGELLVSYAYGIKYLKNALEHVRARESEERDMIDAVDAAVCKDAEWPLKLSEWKMKYKVHNMTPYQTKRFVKWIHTEKERGEDEKDVDG